MERPSVGAGPVDPAATLAGSDIVLCRTAETRAEALVVVLIDLLREGSFLDTVVPCVWGRSLGRDGSAFLTGVEGALAGCSAPATWTGALGTSAGASGTGTSCAA